MLLSAGSAVKGRRDNFSGHAMHFMKFILNNVTFGAALQALLSAWFSV